MLPIPYLEGTEEAVKESSGSGFWIQERSVPTYG